MLGKSLTLLTLVVLGLLPSVKAQSATSITAPPTALPVIINGYYDEQHRSNRLPAHAVEPGFGNPNDARSQLAPTPPSSPTATPDARLGLVQSVSTNSNLNTVDGVLGSVGNPGNPFWINLPNPAGSGNCLIIGLSCPYSASRSIQIADNRSNTWVLLRTVNDGKSMSSVYATFNVAAGTRNLTVTFDTLLYDCQFCVSEFYGIASSNALDGTSSATTSASSAIASGQVVTTMAGDLVYQYGYDRSSPDTGSSTIMGFTPGNGFNLLSANVFLGVFSQFAIQQSAGAIVPSVTLSGSSDAFNTVAVALKSAPQGTVPGPGIRIVHVQHFFYNRAIADHVPCSGNLIYAATAFGQGNAVLNSVTDTQIQHMERHVLVRRGRRSAPVLVDSERSHRSEHFLSDGLGSDAVCTGQLCDLRYCGSRSIGLRHSRLAEGRQHDPGRQLQPVDSYAVNPEWLGDSHTGNGLVFYYTFGSDPGHRELWKRLDL
jgi:hypothetical protein